MPFIKKKYHDGYTFLIYDGFFKVCLSCIQVLYSETLQMLSCWATMWFIQLVYHH